MIATIAPSGFKVVIEREEVTLTINGFDHADMEWLTDRINGTELARAELAVLRAKYEALRGQP